MMTKKFTSILISTILLISSFILPAFAENDSDADTTTAEESSDVSEDLSNVGVLNILTCGEGSTNLSVGTHEYKYECTETLTLIPNSGYSIHGVEINGEFRAIEGKTVSIDIVIGQSVTVKPVFKGNVIFNVEQRDGGKVTPEGTSYIGSGNFFDIVVTPDIGYICTGIFVNDVTIDMTREGNIYRGSFKAPRETTYNVYATFKPIETHTITLEKTGNGTVLPFDDEGHAFVNSGSDAIFQAIPDDGYGISSIKINGDSVEWSADGIFSYKNVTADFTVKIDFVEMVSIPVQITSTGKGKISSATRAYAGTTLSLDVLPDEGYEIVTLTMNETPIALDESGKLKVAITDDIIAAGQLKINVVFDAIVEKFVIRTNVKNGIGGTITAEGYVFENMQTEVREGGSITLSFTPDMGYILTEVKINSIVVKLSAENKYTISNISQSYNVSATFSVDPTASGDFVKVDVLVGKGGAVTSNPPISSTLEYIAELGGSISFTFIPDDGYILDYIVVNGTETIITGNQYVFENIITDSKLEIYFKSKSPEDVTEGNITWGTFETIVDITSTTIVTKDQFEKIKEKAHNKPLIIQAHNYSWTIPANSIYPANDTDFGVIINEDIAEEIKSKIRAKIEEKLSENKIQSLDNIIIETKGIILPIDSYLTVYAGSNFIGKDMNYLSYDYQNNKLQSIAEKLNEGMEEPVYSDDIKVGNDGKVSFPYNSNQYVVLTVSATSKCRFNVDIVGNGSVSPRGESIISLNNSIHLQITPNNGYMVGSITVNGTISYEEYTGKTDGFTIPFGNITQNTDVVVTFVPAGTVSSEDGDIDTSSNGIKPLTVALIIIGVAVVGGIVLFIYKWNEEKDIVD